MKYSILIFLFAVPLWMKGDMRCERMQVKYATEIKKKLYPAERRRDSTLASKGEIELHLAEGIEGEYRIIFNDSIYYSGMLRGDPRIGFYKDIIYLKLRKHDNILVLENLEDGSKATIIVNSRYRYLSLFLKKYCIILAKSSNTRPFRG